MTGVETIDQVLGANIRQRRIARRRTQAFVATAMQHLECRWGTRTVRAIETGQRALTVRELLALALVLGTDPADLLGPLRLDIAC